MASSQWTNSAPYRPGQSYHEQNHQPPATSYSYGDNSSSGYGSSKKTGAHDSSVEMNSFTPVQSSHGASSYTLDPPSYSNNNDYNNSNSMDVPLVPDKAAAKTFEQAFEIERPVWNDVWAGGLFILVALGFVAVSGYSLSQYAGADYTDPPSIGYQTSTLMLFVFVVIMSLILGYTYFLMARIFTKQIIWITGVLNIVVLVVTAAYALYRRAWVAGVLLVVASVFSALALFSWRKRIPFSVLMFQTAVDVAKNFGHAYLVSFLGGLITALFGVLLAFTLVAIWVRFAPDVDGTCLNSAFDSGCSEGAVAGLFTYTIFAAYWITEWLKNTIHTIISGLYGSWYFSPRNPVKGVTRGAARRALTYSFGSISLGSLVVALLDFLRFLCHVAQSTGEDSWAFCILGCILSCIQGAIEFLNRYAFSHMALYGNGYFKSAKDTWKMIKDRGIDALINECLVGPVLSMGALFIAVLCAFLAFGYLQLVPLDWNDDHKYTSAILAYTFLVSLQVVRCFTVPLSSGMDTIFVAAAWDPETLMREHAELYQQMVTVFPQVEQSIQA